MILDISTIWISTEFIFNEEVNGTRGQSVLTTKIMDPLPLDLLKWRRPVV